MSNCLYCKGKLKPERVTRVQEYDGHWYIIENVPAMVCEQCGEIYYTPDAHDRVVELISSGQEPIRTEIVPVLDAG